jgi:hypothetical protein
MVQSFTYKFYVTSDLDVIVSSDLDMHCLLKNSCPHIILAF